MGGEKAQNTVLDMTDIIYLQSAYSNRTVLMQFVRPGNVEAFCVCLSLSSQTIDAYFLLIELKIFCNKVFIKLFDCLVYIIDDSIHSVISSFEMLHLIENVYS